jgi:hypothetical protein
VRPIHPVALSLLFVANNPSWTLAQDAALIGVARRVTVASLDSGQSRLPFEEWLADLGRVPRSAIHWEVNDCGEGGDGRAAPTCVEAGIELAPDTAVYATLIVAALDGSAAPPAIWMLFARTGRTFTEFKRLPEWAAFVRAHNR